MTQGNCCRMAAGPQLCSAAPGRTRSPPRPRRPPAPRAASPAAAPSAEPLPGDHEGGAGRHGAPGRGGGRSRGGWASAFRPWPPQPAACPRRSFVLFLATTCLSRGRPKGLRVGQPLPEGRSGVREGRAQLARPASLPSSLAFVACSLGRAADGAAFPPPSREFAVWTRSEHSKLSPSELGPVSRAAPAAPGVRGPRFSRWIQRCQAP